MLHRYSRRKWGQRWSAKDATRWCERGSNPKLFCIFLLNSASCEPQDCKKHGQEREREKQREREREGGRSSGPATEDKKGEEGGIGSIVSVPRGGKGRGFGPRTLYSRWTVVDSASTGQGWDVFRTHWEALSGPWLRAVNARRRDGYRYRWKISPQE